MTRVAIGRALAVLLLPVLAFTLLAGCGDDGDAGGVAPVGVDDDADRVSEADTEGADGEDAETGDGAATDVDDGCDLVTSADAEDILGEPVAQEEATSGVPDELIVTECIWGAADQDSVGLVQFRVWDGPQFFGKESFAEEQGFEEVAGVGDDAFFSGLNLQVLVDGLVIDIAPSGMFDDGGRATVKDKVVALAKAVVEEIS